MSDSARHRDRRVIAAGLVALIALGAAASAVLSSRFALAEALDRLDAETAHAERLQAELDASPEHSTLRVGDPMPEIALAPLEAEVTSRESLRGGVTLLVLGARWSEPSERELVALAALDPGLRERGLTVIAALEDSSRDNVVAFAARHALPFAVLHDTGYLLAARMRAPGMPTTYLVGRDGLVRYVHHGYRSGDVVAIETEIRELLDEP